jgi:hypothetical protein
MELRYLGFRAARRATALVSAPMRRRRMQLFRRLMGLDAGRRLLDVGGRPEFWAAVPESLDLTILNLPGETGAEAETHHRVTFVEGDACAMPQFADASFDIVFSNSVIEHVGGEARQRAFAREVRRIGAGYWVQTPSKWFPIEAHTGMPLWWFYPPGLRGFFLRRWSRKLPGWSRSMAETRVLESRWLCELFPEAQLHVERLAGLPKSYVAFRPRRDPR